MKASMASRLPLLVIRPEPGCAATVAAAQAAGLDAAAFPLFEVEPVAWALPPADEIDALVLGSANALRHGGAGLRALAGKPAYAVGQATADAAQQAGFDVVALGNGGLQSVMAQVFAKHRCLLRLGGEERLPLDPPCHATLIERSCYRVQARPIGADLADRLCKPAVIALHSAEAARHFSAECERLEITKSVLHLAALGPRILVAAGHGWAASGAAPIPREGELLALTHDLCHWVPGP